MSSSFYPKFHGNGAFASAAAGSKTRLWKMTGVVCDTGKVHQVASATEAIFRAKEHPSDGKEVRRTMLDPNPAKECST